MRRRDDHAMGHATRAIGGLLALGLLGMVGAVMIAAPAHARPGETPPITVPSSSAAPVPTTVPGLPSVEVPSLPPVGPAPVSDLAVLQGTGGLVSLLPASPEPPRVPAPAPGAVPSPPPDGSPALAPAPEPPPPAVPPAAGVTPAAASSPAAAPGPTPAAQSEAAAPDPIGAVVRAVRSFTPLFVLAAVVVVFLVVQGRVDRGEAKLATAAIERDVLEFG